MRLIDADALIEKIKDYPYGYRGMIEADIAQMPTIDPVKHGRWVKQTDENCWWYECSECGDYPLKNAYGHEVLSKYCPNCGARMEGGEEG